MTQKRIFLTNDDGIDSPGLFAAVRALVHLGEVTVVAPLRQQTAMGQSHRSAPNATLTPKKMDVAGNGVLAFSCDCSPAVAVRHGLDVLFQGENPDLIVAGINYGENLGIKIGVSGTVGAACEGASRGIPAIAISKQTDVASHKRHTRQNWDAPEHFLRLFAKRLLTQALPPEIDVLKIDVPDDATQDTPWQLTKLARHPYYAVDLPNPSLESHVADAAVRVNASDAWRFSGTDIHALSLDRAVSVTPLTLDNTAHTSFPALRELLDKE